MISCRHKVTIFFQSFAYSTYIIYTHGHSFSANGVPRAEVSNFLSFFFIGKTKERKDGKGILRTKGTLRDERDFKGPKRPRRPRGPKRPKGSRYQQMSATISYVSLVSFVSYVSYVLVTRCHTQSHLVT